MSHAVAIEDLANTAAPYGSTPFLLYVGSSGTARVNHVSVAFGSAPGQLRVTGYGRGVPKTLTPDLQLSLLWPPHELGGFSLIADGTAVLDDSDATEALALTITGAVLHRPAPTNSESTC